MFTVKRAIYATTHATAQLIGQKKILPPIAAFACFTNASFKACVASTKLRYVGPGYCLDG